MTGAFAAKQGWRNDEREETSVCNKNERKQCVNFWNTSKGECTVKNRTAGDCQKSADPNERFCNFVCANCCFGPIHAARSKESVPIDNGYGAETDNEAGDENKKSQQVKE